ncbi:nephrin-like isoform X2 [Penaeus vannamei]|uniref:nephrin-like isoform X2 n=1 Tax=Penaeus vannamei TaxID=6689 RepID=UPI00387FA351
MRESPMSHAGRGSVRPCLLGLLFLASLAAAAAGPSDDTVYASATAVLNERGRLPCDVSSQLANDRVVLILWYRGSTGTPLYSFDSRGDKAPDGKHWYDEVLLDKRAYFQLLPGGNLGTLTGHGAFLEVFPVQDRDQAIYRCRVDYLLSPTKNTIVNFTVVIPPNKPEIFNANATLQLAGGRKEVNVIGPFNEGSELVLVCRVQGGRPPPEVVWLVDRKAWPTEVTREGGGYTRASLVLPRLTRNHLNAIIECRASTFNGSASSSSVVTLDMNFRPTNVTIVSAVSSLSDGTDYEIVCQTWGSKPAAVITWWKGGTMALKNALMTTSADSNVTTSILKYKAGRGDNGKYLTCRAENTVIPQSAREDGFKLNIYYKPVVTLRMGSNLDPEKIKEKDDVYFECHINANPVVTRIFWYHNGSPLEHRVTRGVIIQNQTLVLQSIGRDAAGFYTCRAINMEGEGESQPVELKVMYKPYCRRQSKTIYGTALHEPASVTCEVEASPGPVTFRWTFNNTSEHLPISASAVTSHDFTSVASYAPKSHLDYGTLLCWALNDIGAQAVPCAFAIIPAGPPDKPKNCSIANQTTDTIEVECAPGFDGGLPQTFFMEVYDSTTGVLHRNISSQEPLFLLTALRPGLAFLMVTYAANAKGKSVASKLETYTLKVAEKRTGPPALFEFTPVLWIVMGVMASILLLVAVLMLVMKFRKPSPAGQEGRTRPGQDEAKVDLDNKPLNVGSVLRARARSEGAGGAGGGDGGEDNDPDLIPHKADIMAYPPYESLEGGPAVSSSQFSSAFEMVPTARSLPLQAPVQLTFY